MFLKDGGEGEVETVGAGSNGYHDADISWTLTESATVRGGLSVGGG